MKKKYFVLLAVLFLCMPVSIWAFCNVPSNPGSVDIEFVSNEVLGTYNEISQTPGAKLCVSVNKKTKNVEYEKIQVFEGTSDLPLTEINLDNSFDGSLEITEKILNNKTYVVKVFYEKDGIVKFIEQNISTPAYVCPELSGASISKDLFLTKSVVKSFDLITQSTNNQHIALNFEVEIKIHKENSETALLTLTESSENLISYNNLNQQNRISYYAVINNAFSYISNNENLFMSVFINADFNDGNGTKKVLVNSLKVCDNTNKMQVSEYSPTLSFDSEFSITETPNSFFAGNIAKISVFKYDGSFVKNIWTNPTQNISLNDLETNFLDNYINVLKNKNLLLQTSDFFAGLNKSKMLSFAVNTSELEMGKYELRAFYCLSNKTYESEQYEGYFSSASFYVSGTLSTPIVQISSSGKASFAVEYASSYEIKINDEPSYFTTLTTIQLLNNQTIKVKAYGENKTLANPSASVFSASDWSESKTFSQTALSAPTITLLGDMITWSAVPHANAYQILYYFNGQQKASSTCYETNFPFMLMPHGLEYGVEYQICVVAKDSNYEYAQSPESNFVSYTFCE